MAARYLEDLRGSYKGKEIWVLGCGYDLDNFPDDFFDDKVSITLNWGVIAFPNCTYFLSYHKRPSDFIRKYLSKFTHKWILWFPPEDITKDEWIPKHDLIMMQRRVRECAKGDFNEAVRAIMNGESCEYVDTGTILHGGIQAAAVLGATKITLVGSTLRPTPDKDHAQKRGMWMFYQDNPARDFPIMASVKPPPYRDPVVGLSWFAEAFKNHGVEFMRYTFNKGYEKIEGDISRRKE